MMKDWNWSFKNQNTTSGDDEMETDILVWKTETTVTGHETVVEEQETLKSTRAQLMCSDEFVLMR